MGQLKFGRTYTLVVQVSANKTITIKQPITLELDVLRDISTSSYLCQLRLYNLNPEHRNQIRYNFSNFNEFKRVQLSAGYGEDNESVIFDGNMSQAWSVREGTNYITQIECIVGGFATVNAQTNTSFKAGTPLKTIMTSMVETLPYTDPGVIGDYEGAVSRGCSFVGNTVELLRDLSGGGFFFDNGKANVLKSNEVISIPNGVTFITPKSGLLNTPVLEKNIVTVDLLFEPGLNVAQRISLTSFTESDFNGDYKVISVKHRGVISGAVSGQLITTARFYFSKFLIPAGFASTAANVVSRSILS